MANATLTLKIAGTVNGKTIAYTGTQTIDNVDTVISRIGQAVVQDTAVTHGPTGTEQTPIAEQDHDLLLIANVDSRADLKVNVTTAAGNVTFKYEPGAFLILQKADAGGIMNQSTTATTSTVQSTTVLQIGRYDKMSGAPRYLVMGTYNYAS